MSDPLQLAPAGIPEPVPKDVQALYVQASQNLQWLAENGVLVQAAGALADLRSQAESILAAAAAHRERVEEGRQ